ncbi:MAG TPA: hypothetical protein VE422_46445 [Terriglobia bacterium]|nr:hypothetical protein [Terriglobia bacterium]
MHLRTETALDLLDGRMEQGEETFWKDHLQSCKGCKGELSVWQQLGTDMKRFHLMSAPDEDVKKAIHIFSRQSERVQATLRHLIATIMIDSFREPAFAGSRGAAGTARQLVLRAEEFDIHIKIWGEREHRQMLGQLLPRGETFVRVARFHLLRNGERLETTGVDDVGEFHFTEVPEGDLSLQIDLPNLTVIGALNVKEVQ